MQSTDTKTDWPRPRWRVVLLYGLAIATPLGWSLVAFAYLGMNAWGRTLSFQRAVLIGLPDWYLWALAAPVVFALAERFRIERGRWASSVAIHLLAGSAVALVEIAAVVGVNTAFGVRLYEGPLTDIYLRMVLRTFHFYLIIYCVIVAASHAYGYYAALRERELTASTLRAELVQAQLSSLRMQLQPHFFFNTLHSIAALVRDGRGDDAVDTIGRLGDLMRRTLRNVDQDEISLREEIGMVEQYLEIEQTRYQDRLTVRIDVAPETLDARVPYLALQPLVENAIRHGIAQDPAARRVSVEARRANGSLCVEITNDGPSPGGHSAAAGSGVGLANIRARLQRLYGSRFALEVGPASRGGTVARLQVPWRTQSPAAPEAA